MMFRLATVVRYPRLWVGRGRWQTIYRHPLTIRLTHWINLVCMTILLMSGLQIFNAHPALYWGSRSEFEHPVLAMTAAEDKDGRLTGWTTILGRSINTTGVLGASAAPYQQSLIPRGFPAWATLPSQQWLAMGRRWHFFFAWIFVANGLVYALYSLLGRHFWRDLLPTGRQLRHIGAAVWDHARLRFPRGEEARHYNVLQKISYVVVAFGMAPLMIATGLTMSPWMDAAFPQLLTLFGGRQSARTIHFVTAFALLAFVLVHLLMVVLSGPWNNLRSMITGRYKIEVLGETDERAASD